MTKDYKDTVFLPKTLFAMKANLALREKDFLKYWQEIDLYSTLRTQSQDLKKFILHWGPPYANGHLHCGHALTYILKDMVNKTYQMAGYNAPLVPGWDCHGLPIELKVEEQYRAQGQRKEDVDVFAYIASCRAYANQWIEIQSIELQRLGIVADWQNPYITMDFKNEAKIAAELGKFLMNGGLYRGLKPVMWSVVERTALAEAEVEYHDHTSDAVFVAFPIVTSSLPILKGAYAVIWTTTPWTLPGNRAIAYGADHNYSVIEVLDGTDLIPSGLRLLLAKDLITEVTTALEINYGMIGHLSGATLQGTICHHPWHGQGYDFAVPMLPGAHVTTDAGTGLVHTAPGHGLEDFLVGQEFGLEVPETVQGDGTYYHHVPLFAGKHIFKIGSEILEKLTEAGALLKSSKLVHSYPHSWRSKTPLIYRATSQWFISMDTNDLRAKAMREIDQVEWIPTQGKNRISAMVSQRPDWCLSRQRTWGVPITVFVHKVTGEALRDATVHQRIVEAIALEGIAAWHKYDSVHFLGSDYVASDFEKAKDILDVWFDSACTHTFILENNGAMAWPADMYFEGSDQHRGWFQTSLLHSCGTRGRAPYVQVLTHGFVLDEKGYKMSKSQGNGVDPQQVIDTLGADMLRLWVASTDYTDDVRIGAEILKHTQDVYRRLRNTLRYLLGALAEYDPKNAVAYDELPSLERWVLHRLKDMEKSHQKLLKTYDFAAFYSELHTFCATDLSAFYFDIRKDTLYCDAPNGVERLAALNVMHHVFTHLVHWLAPVLSFTAEEAWHTYQKSETPNSIHAQRFPKAPRQWDNPSIAARWEDLRNIRKVLTGALEVERAAKTIGSSLQASLIMYVGTEWADRLTSVDWAELAISSQCLLVRAQMPANAFTLEEVKGIGVVVEIAEGQKCGRCWKITREVGSGRRQDLCSRCDEVVHAHFPHLA